MSPANDPTSEFLENLDEATFFGGSQTSNPLAATTSTVPVQSQESNIQTQQILQPVPDATISPSAPLPVNQQPEQQPEPRAPTPAPKPKPKENTQSILPAATKKERFLLIAADQEAGSRDERLSRVIQAKYEAGLLKPYNYVKGYARLSRWMDRKYVSLMIILLRRN